MASTIVTGRLSQITTAAITDVVTTGSDGYIIKVHNPGYVHVGFSVYASGITADGADSVLWLQGLVLDHNMNIASDCDDAADNGACHLTTKHYLASGNSAGWECVTSGGAGAITVDVMTVLYTQSMTITHVFLGYGFALKIRGDAGADSWTAGNLEIMPLAWGGR